MKSPRNCLYIKLKIGWVEYFAQVHSPRKSKKSFPEIKTLSAFLQNSKKSQEAPTQLWHLRCVSTEEISLFASTNLIDIPDTTLNSFQQPHLLT